MKKKKRTHKTKPTTKEWFAFVFLMADGKCTLIARNDANVREHIRELPSSEFLHVHMSIFEKDVNKKGGHIEKWHIKKL